MTLWRLVGLSELVCRSAGVSRHSHSNNNNNNNNNNSNNSTDKVCKTPCGSMWRYVDVGDKIIREIHWFEVFAYKTPCGHICKGGEAKLTWISSISSQFACTCAWYWFWQFCIGRIWGRTLAGTGMVSLDSETFGRYQHTGETYCFSPPYRKHLVNLLISCCWLKHGSWIMQHNQGTPINIIHSYIVAATCYNKKQT